MGRLVLAQPELVAFVRALLPSAAADVQDVVQNINLALIRRSGDYDASRPFRPWLLAFARRIVWQYRRDHAAPHVIFDSALFDRVAAAWAETVPDEPAAELLRRLERCKQELTPRQRRLLEAYYRQCRDAGSLAREGASNAHAVTAGLYYIRRRLADCIRRLCRLERLEERLSPDAELVAEGVEGRAAAEALDARMRGVGADAFVRDWIRQSHMDSLLRLEAGTSGISMPGAGLLRPPVRLRRIAAAVLVACLGCAVAWAATALIAGRRPEQVPEPDLRPAPAVAAAREATTGTAARTVAAQIVPAAASSPAATILAAVAVTDAVTAVPTAQAGRIEEPVKERTMNTMTQKVAAAVSAVALSVALPLAGTTAWTCDGTTLSDGAWTFTVSGTQSALSVNGRSVTPTTAAPVDFASVQAATGYVIVNLAGSLFKDCKMINELTLPPTLLSIGEYCFYGCSALTNTFDFPVAVTNAGKMTFQYCGGIHGIVLHADSRLVNIPDFFMGNCEACTTTVVVATNVLTIGGGAFQYGKKMVGDVLIPATCQSIGGNAFMGCKLLTSISFVTNGAILASVGSYAFNECAATNVIVFPSSVTSIGDNLFNWAGVKCVYFPPDMKITSIPDRCFICSSITNMPAIPAAVTSLGTSAFEQCKSMRGDIVIPANVQALGTSCFAQCEKLGSVAFEEGCTNLGKSVFYYCNACTNIVLPRTLQVIGDGAFGGLNQWQKGPHGNIWWQSCPIGVTNVLFYVGNTNCVTNYVIQTQWQKLADTHTDIFTMPANKTSFGSWTSGCPEVVALWSPDWLKGGFVIRICANVPMLSYDWLTGTVRMTPPRSAARPFLL